MASINVLNSWVRSHGVPGAQPPSPPAGGGDGNVIVPPPGETFSTRFSVKLDDPAYTSPAALMFLSTQLQADYAAVGVQTSYESIELDQAQAEETNRQQQEQLQAIADALRKAAEASAASRAAGWGGAAAGAAGAIAGSVALIAMGPLGMLVAAAICIFAALELSNQVLKECDVKTADGTKTLDVGVGGMVDAIIAQQISDGTIVIAETDSEGNKIMPDNVPPGTLVMTKDELSVYQAVWTATAAIGVAGGLAGGGFGAAARFEKVLKAAMTADAAAKAGSSLGRTASTVANAADTAAIVTQAATQTAVTTANVFVANAQGDAKEARAQADTLEAQMKLFSQLIEIHRKAVDEALRQLNESVRNSVEQFKNLSETARYAVRSNA